MFWDDNDVHSHSFLSIYPLPQKKLMNELMNESKELALALLIL